MKSVVIKLFIAVAVIMMGSNVNAQIQKGNVLVGSNIGNLKLGLKSGSDNSFSLNPKAGIFVKDGLAVGLDFSFGTTHAGGQDGSTISYGIGTFGRYYITDETVQVLKHGKFFVEANLGFQGQDTKGGASTNGLGFSFGPGYAFFITPNISLETSIEYEGIVGFGSEAYQNNLLWNLGFQIYFPYKSAANKIKSGI